MRYRFVLIPNFLGAELSFSTVPNCVIQRVPKCFGDKLSCFQNFFPTLGDQIIYFICKNCQTPPPPPRYQLVVPKTNQEINEPSYEMVGVKITVTNNGQNKSYFSYPEIDGTFLINIHHI